jgi:hypothetical protein
MKAAIADCLELPWPESLEPQEQTLDLNLGVGTCRWRGNRL